MDIIRYKMKMTSIFFFIKFPPESLLSKNLYTASIALILTLDYSNHKWSSKHLELLKNLKSKHEKHTCPGELDNVKIQNRKLLTLTSVCSHIFS